LQAKDGRCEEVSKGDAADAEKEEEEEEEEEEEDDEKAGPFSRLPLPLRTNFLRRVSTERLSTSFAALRRLQRLRRASCSKEIAFETLSLVPKKSVEGCNREEEEEEEEDEDWGGIRRAAMEG
jgi:hypothetical protein